MHHKKYLIIIGGATASGKTALAIRLAQHFGTEILSADSRQFYREMSIGTAKPSETELALVKHHFINNLSIEDDYSVGEFEEQALAVLSTIFEKKDTAIMVGGTGLYIRAVCDGLDDFPEVPLSIRAHFEDIFEKEGIEVLQKILQEVDNEYFTQVDIHNAPRLIRALSVWKVSGKPFSSFRKGGKIQRDFTPIYICLDVPREILYDRINRRVDTMISEGLISEVEKLKAYKAKNALLTVGYSELFDHFEGHMTLAEAIDKIKQHSRNYAKRQMTWFRKDPHWARFSPDNLEEIIDFLQKKISDNVALSDI
jgi:tRNA dimethylallyltransferase